LLPFLFSVTGIVIFQTHCTCTGKNAVSLYVLPESCETALDEHQHLFEHHADELDACCSTADDGMNCAESQPCGCDSPQMKFFKLKNQFTDEKANLVKINISKIVISLLFWAEPVNQPRQNGEVVADYNHAPPLILPPQEFIHFICQSKIPDIA